MLARPFLKTAALATALAIPLALAVAAPATAVTVPVTTWPALKAAFLIGGDTVVLDADITALSGESLAVDAGEAITLDLNGHTLSITTPSTSSPAIRMSDTSTLTINATGSGGVLIATGGDYGAGIGGAGFGGSGTTTINGGTITATGGRYAAGIGGGNYGNGGTTTINGGTITATGGYNGAGIGGGYNGDGGTTTINGGTITATGGDYGAGIGGGYNGNGGATTVTGGNVTATGGTNSAGIGAAAVAIGSIGVLDIQGTPDTGAATDGGGPNASPITNSTTPSGVGYAAETSMVETGGKIIVGFHYLVTFAAAGGDSTPADATINYGGTLAAPTNPSRAGYTFSSWTASGTAYNFSSPVTSPLTLTATWTAAVTPASSDLLPATGNDATPAVSSAVLLLLAGLTLIAVRRRTSAR